MQGIIRYVSHYIHMQIGRIEDVHFNPWFSCAVPFIEYQTSYGRAFVMGRSDWEYVFNTFAFGSVSGARGVMVTVLQICDWIPLYRDGHGLHERQLPRHWLR